MWAPRDLPLWQRTTATLSMYMCVVVLPPSLTLRRYAYIDAYADIDAYTCVSDICRH